MSRPRVRVPSPAPIPSRTSAGTPFARARDTPHPGKARSRRAGARVMAELPSGTVTFLFTDIEGSTRLWEEHPDAMRGALARHDAILRAGIEANGGQVFKTMGDAFCAAF